MLTKENICVILVKNILVCQECVMSRESKIIRTSIYDAEKTIYHYESFGWELLSINGEQITMSRETQNPVYTDLVKSQAKYESLMQEYQGLQNPVAPAKPAPFKFGTCLLLLILAVIPGALYIAYKVKQNVDYNNAYAAYATKSAAVDKKRKDILAEMDQVARDSRATFFGKHE